MSNYKIKASDANEFDAISIKLASPEYVQTPGLLLHLVFSHSNCSPSLSTQLFDVGLGGFGATEVS